MPPPTGKQKVVRKNPSSTPTVSSPTKDKNAMQDIPDRETTIRPNDPKLNGKKIAVWMSAGETSEERKQYLSKKKLVEFDCHTPIFVQTNTRESIRQAAHRALNETPNITIPFGADLKRVCGHCKLAVSTH